MVANTVPVNRKKKLCCIVYETLVTTNHSVQNSKIVYYCIHVNQNEPPHYKTNKMACALSEASGQTGRIFAVCMKKDWILSYPLSAQRRLWSAWASSDQTGRMPKLILVFAGRTCHFVGFVTMWLILLGSIFRSKIHFVRILRKKYFFLCPIIFTSNFTQSLSHALNYRHTGNSNCCVFHKAKQTNMRVSCPNKSYTFLEL